MHTYKTAIRVLLSKRLIILIYVGFLCLMMFGLSWMFASQTASLGSSDTYEPTHADVAIINQDAEHGRFAEDMRAFLSHDSDIIDIGSTAEQMQTAVASNYVDLIIIIPDGYTSDLAKALDQGTTVPQLEVVTSYTSAYGSLARLQLDDFLTLTRIDALAQHASQQHGHAAITAATLTDAADRVLTATGDQREAFPEIAVAKDPHANEDMEEAARITFINTVKMGVYPLLVAMMVTTALTMSSFSLPNVRRRLYASPQHTGPMVLAEFLGCATFGLAIGLLFFGISLALPALAGLPITGIPVLTLVFTLLSSFLYAVVGVACGFMVSMLSSNDVVVNAAGNVYGLLVMFTSGVAFPISMMPDFMIAIGKLTPGWWLCQSIDAISGENGRLDIGAWAQNCLLVALFGATFILIGLAVSKLRRTRPSLEASGVTQLIEA
ncbi:ABC transporter permease [Bifidobacterium gallicum]|uniref:ABC-2 type transporter n=1 Tax=Bifidobacterium gallicum DSM 20093 = LMG 11596 TaxID=561180 RepID=D1NT51_9BIFI|nr:ABC transporter permease [Bifidobacterium gallicum]EFA23853.1 ABC-2 type transporter [Bifidobacterium gallicum DSM 20093 = LMG 11596]KFI59159.1 ABC-2 type transporter family protein [Bifidobacterium gallicum DSM 20093 = LMG 11596]